VALQAVVDDIHTQLATIDGALATAQPTSLLGARYLSEQAAPPRVVWVALKGKPGALRPSRHDPARVRLPVLDVACHIWGADPASAEVAAQRGPQRCPALSRLWRSLDLRRLAAAVGRRDRAARHARRRRLRVPHPDHRAAAGGRDGQRP
jgi:hypothetical protein